MGDWRLNSYLVVAFGCVFAVTLVIGIVTGDATAIVAAVIVLVAAFAADAGRQGMEHLRSTRAHLRRQGRVAQKRRIAELEAATGVPVLTQGECAQCHKPLIAGAKYCSYCQTPVQPFAIAAVCGRCGCRNLDDARFCGECGLPLHA